MKPIHPKTAEIAVLPHLELDINSIMHNVSMTSHLNANWFTSSVCEKGRRQRKTLLKKG